MTTTRFARTHRLTITVNDAVFSYLERTSVTEGRSLSNLAAYLLETAIVSRTPCTLS